MGMTLRQESFQSLEKKEKTFDADAVLNNNGWHPHVSALEAETLLAGKPIYTYLTRPSGYDRSFMVSFVDKNGKIAHDHFSLIDPIHGIWRNSHASHVGKLEKVIRDMLRCSIFEGQPLC